MDFWAHLFSSVGFMPRSVCGGGWTPDLIRLHLVGDSLTGLAYLIIPLEMCILWRLYRAQRLNIAIFWARFRKTMLLYMAFILCCGGTHINQVLVFTYPLYRFFGVWTLLTGLVSLACVFWLAWCIGLSVLVLPPNLVEDEIEASPR